MIYEIGAEIAAPITIYTTRWCGHCRRLARRLAEAGIEAPMIDIDRDEHAHHGRRIEQQTGGYRTVPAVEIGDRLLVNPTVAEVTEALAESAPPPPKRLPSYFSTKRGQ
ncbi:MAG: glutaredoxin family protein [Actinomycetota bacterium]|nr:glutaredoxin family protein [Actinomycetota bacterium]